MGYPNDLLSTRALLAHGRYALVPPEGRVNNVIPNLKDCVTSVLCSPELGAKFVFSIVTVAPGGGTTKDFCEDGIETFVFCLNGKGKVTTEGKTYDISQGGYVFAPASEGLGFTNDSAEPWRLVLYKQRYRYLEGYSARVVVGNINEIPEVEYAGMANVFLRDLLPTDLGFDVNFHTLSFEPGGSHNFVETHLQEHGLYFYEGEGVYLIDDKWIPVKSEDFIWFGPYVPQAFYGAGRGRATYIYTKDCNRDVSL